MSAPDPTAGERLCGPCRRGQTHLCDGNEYLHCDNAATPDADAASEPLTEAERADWPKPGLLGRVKCSDTRWRTAFCVDGPSGLEWVFADNARRRVDTSTAMSLLADPELVAAATKARADERERIAQAIEALPGPNGVGLARWTHSKAKEGYLLAIEEAAVAARIARGDA